MSVKDDKGCGTSMDITKIKQLLRFQTREDLRRGWRCPDEMELAGYVSGPGDSQNKKSIETHLADCDFCISQVAFLTRSAEWNDAVDVPASMLSRARNLVVGKPNRLNRWNWQSNWRWTATAAALASLALLVVVIALQWQKSLTGPDDGFVALDNPPVPVPSTRITTPSPERREAEAPSRKVKPAQSPIVRSEGPDELTPKLIMPSNGAILQSRNLEFKWAPVSDVIFYEVRIMSADGDLVFEQRTENTSLKPGAGAQLSPATKYFVSVRAQLRQGKASKSSVVSFQVAGP